MIVGAVIGVAVAVALIVAAAVFTNRKFAWVDTGLAVAQTCDVIQSRNNTKFC